MRTANQAPMVEGQEGCVDDAKRRLVGWRWKRSEGLSGEERCAITAVAKRGGTGSENVLPPQILKDLGHVWAEDE